MTIYFGLELDDELFLKQPLLGGTYYMGANRLLRLLEMQLGFQGYPSDNEHLRIEQYRQAITQHLSVYPNTFYSVSFWADQLATATDLLSRRDELKLAGWRFDAPSPVPERLQVLAELEQKIELAATVSEKPSEKIIMAHGFADRFTQVLNALPNRKLTIQKIHLVEPLHILPIHFQRLFEAMQQTGIAINTIPEPSFRGASDLNTFQAALQDEIKPSKQIPKADGSLIILQSKRETDAATYIAKLLRRNPSLQPLILSVEKNRTLDNAFSQDGLPSMGILSASSARPMLQIIKLAPAFLWEPIDPYKIMEFVTLKVKPLEEELANRIARQLAETPGIGGERWLAMIRNYFEELEAKASSDKNIDLDGVRDQYRFWFRRTRYNISDTVPIQNIAEIYQYLSYWAFKQFEENGSRNQSLLVLSEQARRIKELLETLPEAALSYLELERIIRTIYESSPVLFKAQEVGFYNFIHHTSSFIAPVRQLLWWNFVQMESSHFFSRWYADERTYLAQFSVRLETPQDENARLIWQRRQPIVHAEEQVILVMPERIVGKEAQYHPLFSDLQATFKHLDRITIHIDQPEHPSSFSTNLELPHFVHLVPRALGNPKPFIHLESLNDYLVKDYETYTSLDALLYYPYQWVFRYKTRLIKSSILSVVKDRTLLGNLAHRFFEQLLKQDVTQWNKAQVEQWIDEQSKRMFTQEGASLLMYGREPEKVNFLNRLKYAAWSLISILQNNNWQVQDTEMDVVGKFLDLEIRAKADLVLKRGKEVAIVDLKWRGISHRESMIRNQEDLQLALYSKLIDEPDNWAHTSYFIIEKGKLIARNTQAFQEANPIQPDADHTAVHEAILKKMEKTYQWRQQQIENGWIEVRCDQTKHSIEAILESLNLPSVSMDLLEMKNSSAPFDDYKTLINLIF